MDIAEILGVLDEEIARLTQVRTLLAGRYNGGHDVPKRRLSAEARKRIADAQRKRWAEAKKAAK
jgi:hypothetical protein